MGKHSDPDTLALINRLKRKGESLGFWVKEEYILKPNEYEVDLVWKINEDQEPFVTFEIETTDNVRVFSNTSKIFDTPSDYVTKPWFHYMIIHKSHLSKGHKQSLSRQISSYNIRLFESTYNDETKIKSIEDELERLAFNILPFFNKYLENTSLGESMPEIINAINKKLKSYPLKNPRLEWRIVTDEPSVEEYNDVVEFKVRHTSKKGDPILLDNMKEAIKTRMPIVINGSDIQIIRDKKGVFKDAKKIEKIVIGMKNAYPPLILTTPNKGVTIPDLLFSITKNDENIFCVSTEDRNEPYHFEFCFSKKGKEDKMKIRLDTTIASQLQIKTLESIIMEAQEEKEIILINALNGKIFSKIPLRGRRNRSIFSHEEIGH